MRVNQGKRLVTEGPFAETDLLISPTVFDLARWEEWRRQERPLVMDIEWDGLRP